MFSRLSSAIEDPQQAREGEGLVLTHPTLAPWPPSINLRKFNKAISDGNISTTFSHNSHSSIGSHHPSGPETDHYEIPSTAALFKEFEDNNEDGGGGGGVGMLDELNDTIVLRGGSRGLIQTAEQQSDQKQKNLYQMIQMLSTRLSNLDEMVEERRFAAREDLNANSSMCSSQTKRLTEDMPNLHSLGILHGPGTKTSSTISSSTGVGNNGGISSSVPQTTSVSFAQQQRNKENASLFGPVRLAYRHTTSTDAERRIEAMFEAEYGYGKGGSHVHGIGSGRRLLGGCNGGGGGLLQQKKKREAKDAKARLHQKILENRKVERLKYERKLQVNVEEYVTRTLTDLEYKRPPETKVGDDELPAKLLVTQDSLEEEIWPIPLDATQMNPRLLLNYACERIVLHGHEKAFKHLAVSPLSCRILVWLYWLMHCIFFQENSKAEQIHLLRNLSRAYVQFLSSHRGDEIDYFYQAYPYLLAHALIWAFYYLCPGSRHLYNATFKRILYLQTLKAMTGTEVSPASIQIMRHRLFPDEDLEEEDEREDVLPSLPKSKPQAKAHLASLFSLDSSGEEGEEGDSPEDGRSTANEMRGEDNGGSITAATRSAGGESSVGCDTRLDMEQSVLGQESLQDDEQEEAATLISGEGVEKQQEEEHEGLKEERERQGSVSSAIDERESSYSTQQDLPISALVCDRKDLRFRPPVPKDLPCLTKLQQRAFFQASKTSPLLQEYLGKQARSRRPINIKVTKPVRWCETGGVETYRKATAESNSSTESYHALYEKNMKEYRRVQAASMKQLHKERRQILMEKKQVMAKRGTIGFERFCVDLVNEINNNNSKGN